jgi:serine/threonine-protein kinase HipA
MTDSLDIYRNRLLIGSISFEGDTASNNFTFFYDQDYLNRRDAYGLGMNIPLSDTPIESARLLNYFDGLLPEGDNRTTLAQLLKSDEDNIGDLLGKLAGDCIGDLAFLKHDSKLDINSLEQYEPLSPQRFKELTRPASQERNLALAEKRFSLTGAQQKIGLFKSPDSKTDTDEEWLLPNTFAPSNFILKPSSLIYPDLPVNEYLCMRLADSCEIEVPEVWILNPESPLYITKRFDRREEDGSTLRLQQEDLCQLLDKDRHQRYENSSGPSLNDVMETISWYSANAYGDKLQFMRLFIFNFLIGNTDAHGKNFSFLRERNGMILLSPAYDIVSVTKYTGIFRDMAMRVGYEYLIDRVTPADWEIFAKQCNARFSQVQELFHDTMSGILANIDTITESLMDNGFTAAAVIREHILQEINEKRDLI